jgi:hypothetical protein
MKLHRFATLAILILAALACSGTQSSAALLINEVDSDTVNIPMGATDPLEFIEIYDTSGISVPLDGYVMVLFNGNGNRAYRVDDLDGFSTSATGYFVAGAVPGAQLAIPVNTIQNGVDAVALYLGNAADFTIGTTTGTLANTTNLVDAIVYKTGADVDGVGLDGLLGITGGVVDEFGRDGLAATGAIDSIGRFPNGSGAARNSTTWTFMVPSPGASNGVPEPSSMLLAAAAALAMCAVRRRQ